MLDIAENVSNYSLVNFIRDPSSEDDYEGLRMKLSECVLLDVVASDEDLEGYAENGIIFHEDVGGWNLCTLADGHLTFGILFTSRDVITSLMKNDSGVHYYYQIAQLSEFFEFVLRNDLPGVLINPDLDDYFIPRSLLYTYSVIFDNPIFKRASDYAFIL